MPDALDSPEPLFFDEHDRRILREVNSDDWAIVRVAELRAAGEKATFRIEWKEVAGRRHYAVTIRRADGSIERPPPADDSLCPECRYHHATEGAGASCLRARSDEEIRAEYHRRGCP